MLHEVMEHTRKQRNNTNSFICPKCSLISRASDGRCLYCGAICEKNKSMSIQIRPDINSSLPRKIARSYPPQVTTPILILSVGRDGVFDARNSPCVITSKLLSCKVKVEGVWVLVEIRPSEVEAMLFSEELQLIFLRLRETPRHALCLTLKVEKLDAAKWLVMVLGNNMQKPSSMNLMVQQLEIFGSTIRQHDGFCKMNYSCDETRKLLLDCGLRLPRAEALAAKEGGTSGSSGCNLAGSSSDELNNNAGDTDEKADQVQLGPSKPTDATVSCSNEGGLLTNVIKNLSSVGMQIINSCQSNLSADSKVQDQNNSEKVDDDPSGDDVIILLEEGTDEHKLISVKDAVQSDQHDSPNNTDVLATGRPSNSTGSGSIEPTVKFQYQPPGSLDSVTITSSDVECLSPGCLVNDAIINFYLKYLYFEQLSDLQRRSSHLFNCFFYSRLASTPNLTTPAVGSGKADQHELSVARHASVAKWTRRVDLFAKDYIIIPINENSHWFLGLVCYPWMAGMVSYTALYQAEAFDMCKLTDQFADVDDIVFADSVDDVSISEEEVKRVADEEPGKAFDHWRRRRLAWLRKGGINAMPCILLFDSLPCQTRVNSLHVIREYLQVEWNSRRSSQDGPLEFNKDTIRGFSPRVPCQSNLVDCGIYLMHYVEMFYKKPVQSYTKVFFQNQLTSWFSDASVSQKRSELLALTKRLHEDSSSGVTGAAPTAS